MTDPVLVTCTECSGAGGFRFQYHNPNGVNGHDCEDCNGTGLVPVACGDCGEQIEDGYGPYTEKLRGGRILYRCEECHHAAEPDTGDLETAHMERLRGLWNG